MNEDAIEPIKEIYQRFKHLDVLLSDRQWLACDDGSDGNALRNALFDMWEAIKRCEMISRTIKESK